MLRHAQLFFKPNYDAEREKCQEFLMKFEDPNFYDDDYGNYKYMA